MGMISGNAPPSGFGSMASPQIARAAEQAKSNLSAKGGQPPTPQQLSQGLQQQEAMQQAANQMGKGGQPPTPAMQNAVQQAAQVGLGNMQQPNYSQQAANAASAINSGMTSGPQAGQIAQPSSAAADMQQRAGMRPRMRRGRYIG